MRRWPARCAGDACKAQQADGLALRNHWLGRPRQRLAVAAELGNSTANVAALHPTVQP